MGCRQCQKLKVRLADTSQIINLVICEAGQWGTVADFTGAGQRCEN